METNKYFTSSENLKIDSFIQIPKILFKNPKYKDLTLTSRLIYSLYLNRYNNTKYKDEIGPYIIFGDKELEEFLAITKATCIRSKKQLLEHNLIFIKKTTGFNRIYIKNYRNPDVDEFYYEQDLESYSFYRFPRVFFEEEFDELSLNSKFLYTYYFDWMCLSQMNYVVDNYNRIYFSESAKDQEVSLCLNKDTIRVAKKQLIAADLLIEYKNFGKVKNYYLLKLANYNHKQIIEFNLLSNKEKNDFIKNISVLNSTVIQVPKINIRQLRKDAGLTVKDMIIHLDNKGITISPQTYNRYEKGTRKCPKELYSEIVDFLKKAIKNENCNPVDIGKSHIELKMQPAINAKEPQKTNFDTSKEKNIVSDIESKKKLKENNNKASGMTKNEAHLIKTNNYTNNKNIEIELIESNNIYQFINLSIKNMKKMEKIMISKSFELLKAKNDYSVNNLKLSKNEINELLCIFKNYDTTQLELYFSKVIERMSVYKDTFKSNNNIANCFLTFVLNDLLKGKQVIDSYVESEEDWTSIWNNEVKDNVQEEKEIRKDESYIDILKQYD